VELHGKSPTTSVVAIIPARFASTRLPGKLLLPLAGKPLLIHTIEKATGARLVDRVVVAADDDRIIKAVVRAGYEAVITSASHPSGSDRVAEVAETLAPGSIVVNVQGDEPMISPHTIDAAVSAMLADESADMVTTCEIVRNRCDVLSSDVVKTVVSLCGDALYFSRSPIPFPREAVRRHDTLERALELEPELLLTFRKHTGIYVYRREFLLKLSRMPQTLLESAEMLEQLRALEMGARIKVVDVTESSIGVDTAADLELVRSLLGGAADGIS
jgi:3-deoxy-manno-octulosonate cytidylyltransferase (CMP-KDO synthetase)